jgi:hypothetical protein
VQAPATCSRLTNADSSEAKLGSEGDSQIMKCSVV